MRGVGQPHLSGAIQTAVLRRSNLSFHGLQYIARLLRLRTPGSFRRLLLRDEPCWVHLRRRAHIFRRLHCSAVYDEYIGECWATLRSGQASHPVVIFGHSGWCGLLIRVKWKMRRWLSTVRNQIKSLHVTRGDHFPISSRNCTRPLALLPHRLCGVHLDLAAS